jgi:hypothetical protein
MKNEIIYIILKLALSRGSLIKVRSKQFLDEARIISYKNKRLKIVKPTFDVNENDNLLLDIVYNGTFKLNGVCVDKNEHDITLKIKEDFQYITKRKDFRIPLFIPIIINDKINAVLVDFNSSNYLALLAFKGEIKYGDLISIKTKNIDDIILEGKCEKVRDELFNMERVVVKVNSKNSQKAIEMFNKLIEYYV